MFENTQNKYEFCFYSFAIEEILVVTTTAQENLPENDESNNNLFHPDFVEEVAVNGTNVEQMLSLQIEPCTLSTNADVPEIINGIHAEEAAVGGFEKHEPPRASIPQEAEEPVDIKPIISGRPYTLTINFNLSPNVELKSLESTDMEPVVDNKNDPVLLKARLEALKQCNDKICVILSSDSEDETKARPRASRFRQLNVSAFIDLGDSDWIWLILIILMTYMEKNILYFTWHCNEIKSFIDNHVFVSPVSLYIQHVFLVEKCK